MEAVRDVFEPNLSFSIEEANGDVDGKHILARVKGEFFVPNGVSRNKRFYSQELWERVCGDAEVKKRLNEKRMYGTIGHNQNLDDDALLQGKVSHIITGMGINEGKGIGEALILDTPAGRVLNTILRAGSKVFVSSRANGDYKGERNGVPMVDPDAYKFTTFDFVVDPGFMQASPNLAESFTKLFEELKNSVEPNFKGESEMSQQLVENLAKENGSLKHNLDEAAKEVASLKDSNTVLTEENRHVKGEADRMRSQLKLLERYKQLGTPEELDRVLTEAEKQGSKIKEIGGVEKCSEALVQSARLLIAYRRIGTPSEIAEALSKSKTTVEAFAKFGKVSELEAAFTEAEGVVRINRFEKSKKRISELAKELRVSEDAVKKVYGKMPEADLKGFFKSLGEVRGPAATFRKSPASAAKAVNEDDKFVSVMDKSRAARLMESFG